MIHDWKALGAMGLHQSAKDRAAFYERVGGLYEVMPGWERAAWRAWDAEHLDGCKVGSSDWPGLDKYRAYLSLPAAPPKRRPNLRRHLRETVLGRDGRNCRLCGDESQPTIDHIRAVANGGTDDLTNLQVLCKPCNSRKGAR